MSKLTCDKPATKRGFKAPCLRCGEAGQVTVFLDDLSNFHCNECGEEFTADDVRAVLASWGKVLDWIDTAPEIEE